MQISPSPSPVPPPTTSPATDDFTFDVHDSFIDWARPILIFILIAFIVIVFTFIALTCIKLLNITNDQVNHMLSTRPERPGSSSSRPRAEPPPTEAIASIICTYKIKKPKKLEAEDKKAAEGSGDGGGSDCAICLEDFEYGDECRMFVSCNHGFHRACIDKWLARDRHCPLCRGSIRGVRFVNPDEQV